VKTDNAPLRRAAAFAFAREHRGETPAPTPEVTAALVAAVADSDAETRAGAIAALGRRKAVGDSAAQIEQDLRDADWRVAVEAVRALAGDNGTDGGKDAVAAIVVRDWAQLSAGGSAAMAHVVLEGLRALADDAARPTVRDAFAAVAKSAAPGAPAGNVAPLVRGWAHCLATLGLERAEPAAFDGGTRLLACGGDAIAPRLRAQLVGEAVGAGVGTPAQRRDAIVVLVATTDAPSRAAGLEAIAKVWPALDARDREALVPALARALAATDPMEAGTAAETAATLLGLPDLAATDPELASSVVSAIGTAKLADGRDACEKAAAGASPVIRAAGEACLLALDGKADAEPPFTDPAAVTPPALDPASVIGARPTWVVETSRGTVEITLAPDVAPWHVASIVALTEKKFYDGLVFHRVVPDFVVQGGDPTGTGWGGAGYTLPAEPASGLDRGGYDAGAVGIADAGKDSGGSQWFIMHSRAPHLEGRYTKIGTVTKGQDVVDTLVIGDRVIQATIRR
jgi:cyclophilin family peptidyl-prolyl cis-trans isomerase